MVLGTWQKHASYFMHDMLCVFCANGAASTYTLFASSIVCTFARSASNVFRSFRYTANARVNPVS